MRLLKFYTTWATLFHILHLYGYIKSTITIAYFVFIVGTILTISNGIPFPTVVFVHLVHTLPLFLITDSTFHYDLLLLSLFLYCVFISPNKIFCIYSNMHNYRTGKINC